MDTSHISFIIHISKNEDGNIHGTLQETSSGQEEPFQSLLHLDQILSLAIKTLLQD